MGGLAAACRQGPPVAHQGRACPPRPGAARCRRPPYPAGGEDGGAVRTGAARRRAAGSLGGRVRRAPPPPPPVAAGTLGRAGRSYPSLREGSRPGPEEQRTGAGAGARARLFLGSRPPHASLEGRSGAGSRRLMRRDGRRRLLEVFLGFVRKTGVTFLLFLVYLGHFSFPGALCRCGKVREVPNRRSLGGHLRAPGSRAGSSAARSQPGPLGWT